MVFVSPMTQSLRRHWCRSCWWRRILPCRLREVWWLHLLAILHLAQLPSGWKRFVAVVLLPEAGQLRPHGDGHISSCEEKLHSSATAVLLTSWESRFRSTLFGVINLSLIKGCQLGRMLSQYNDLLLLHKCQVKAGTYYQSRRHLSCDSVVLKWLTPAAPNGGCKLSGAGAADWKVPPA